MEESHPQPRWQRQGRHWVFEQQRGRGAGAKCRLARLQPEHSRSMWLKFLTEGPVVGFLFPVAIPGGPSAALYPQEGLSAGYHEDLEPAEERQAWNLIVTN